MYCLRKISLRVLVMFETGSRKETKHKIKLGTFKFGHKFNVKLLQMCEQTLNRANQKQSASIYRAYLPK